VEPANDTEPVAADLRALALELGSALSGVHRATRRRVRGELGLEPLSGAQVELLRLVSQSPGIGVSAAARELNLAGNSVSTLVNQLVAKNYLRREPSPSDRRAAVLSATDAGRDRLSRWADQRTRLFAEQLDHLAAAELDALRAAVPALRRLAAGLTEPGAERAEHAEEAERAKERTAP
jgi:DNA-binding MarR family transcriptional regulator